VPRLAPGPEGRYIEQKMAALIGGFLFREQHHNAAGKNGGSA
jgi:hypothetical protein